jgi:hypothetical protein
MAGIGPVVRDAFQQRGHIDQLTFSGLAEFGEKVK